MGMEDPADLTTGAGSSETLPQAKVELSETDEPSGSELVSETPTEEDSSAVVSESNSIAVLRLELEKQQENVEDDSDDNKNENVVGNEVTNTSSKARMLNATNSISNTATTNSVR